MRIQSFGLLTADRAQPTSHVTKEGAPIFEGKGGHFYEYDWDGNVVWEHVDHNQHHDFRRLANGNTLYLAWEEMPPDRARRLQGGVGSLIRPDLMFGIAVVEASSWTRS